MFEGYPRRMDKTKRLLCPRCGGVFETNDSFLDEEKGEVMEREKVKKSTEIEYKTYLQAFSKVKGGSTLTDEDFGEKKGAPLVFHRYSEFGIFAVSLGASDAVDGNQIKTKRQFQVALEGNFNL